MVRRYPILKIQNQIIEACGQSLRLGPLCSSILPPQFDDKIVFVHDFLPEHTFVVLERAAARPVDPERMHIPIHKRGAAISYHDLHDCAPELIAFYQSGELREWCSSVVGCSVMPTPLSDLHSCSLLIYDKPHDHIRCRYDRNFYRGRHFTALLSLVNTNAYGSGVSAARLIVSSRAGAIVVATPPNTFVLFEGAYVYHGATPLKEGERRIVLSMTFCSDPSSTPLQIMRRRFKDTAHFGLRALWA